MKRLRDNRISFWVTAEELAQIEKKMEQVGTTNMSAYLRKQAIDGYIINYK